MNYSASDVAQNARESLAGVLQTLQQEPNVPADVAALMQNIAQTVGALYRAQTAPTERDGKTAVREAMELLSQTLILLQETHSKHPGVSMATERIASVMSALFPLRQRPTIAPPPATASTSIAAEPRRNTQPIVNMQPIAKIDLVQSQIPAASASAEPIVASVKPASERKSAPLRDWNQAAAVSLEANIGATTQTNFYVGFSSDIADGGVFVATYETLAKDTPVELLVTLPGGFEFTCRGFVRFVRDPMDFSVETEPGIGVHFNGLSPEARELALRFIRKRPPMFYDVE